MPIIAKNEGGTYVPAPAGQYVAVCADVVDLGMVTTEWQGNKRTVHKIRIVFLIDEYMDDDRPYTASQQFTLSLNEKANLRKFLEAWRGVPFSSAELRDGFDVERLIGANALVQIVHNDKGERVYANIQAVMKPAKGMKKLAVPDNYVRQKDREPKPPVGDAPPPDEDVAYDDESDGLPF